MGVGYLTEAEMQTGRSTSIAAKLWLAIPRLLPSLHCCHPRLLPSLDCCDQPWHRATQVAHAVLHQLDGSGLLKQLNITRIAELSISIVCMVELVRFGRTFEIWPIF